MKKQNCWEFMKCGKECENDDCFFLEIDICPASTELFMDGINDGKNAGRACWVIADTFCRDEVQGDYAYKIRTCLDCPFYQHVRKEEGGRFITGSELIEMVMHEDEIMQAKLEKDIWRIMRLKKSELVERLVMELGNLGEEENSKRYKTEIARQTVDLFCDSIKESLVAGERVEIRGFGSFDVKHYRGYTGRNPNTGEKIEVPPKRRLAFKPGKELRDMVNKKSHDASTEVKEPIITIDQLTIPVKRFKQ